MVGTVLSVPCYQGQPERCTVDNLAEELRKSDSKECRISKKELEKEMEYYQFLEYEFDCQWNKLKAYANKKGITIIGDLPIYVAIDSADAWANPMMFQMDENGVPSAIAGCPPDAFSADGQMWGNPLYDWKTQEKKPDTNGGFSV